MKALKLVLLILSGLILALSYSSARPREQGRLLGSERLNISELQNVVLPANVNEKLSAASQDLAQVFYDQIGAKLAIQIGNSQQLKQSIILKLDPKGPDDGGYHIQRADSQIRIRSASQDGLCHAVYSLCRDLFNARWYWQGEIGLEYIGPALKYCPEYSQQVKPAFVQRKFWPNDGDFARRNRLIGGFSFNHNLAKIFSAEHFKVSPEAFSTIRGHQYTPKGSGALDPQPNLAHPKAVEIAAAAVLKHFEQHPDQRSFSLSINDNTLFDESKATQKALQPLSYFRSRPNYTDLVFRFMNEVAELVFEKGGAWQTASGQDRYLTALAYYWTEASPSFPIHPRVMPVLTSDRAQWHDPAYRQQDKALITRWANSGAERVATWDYYFGAPYPYPRQFNQWIIESIKHLHQAGVDVFFSQLPAAWGLDGAKAWLAAELLWDPTQNAQALLNEYYDNFFGAAAQAIRQFYELAEAQRNAHAGKADWIKYYKDPAGICLFPAKKLAAMRTKIEQAKAAVRQDPRRLARIEIVSQAFELTETYAAYNQARAALTTATLLQSKTLPALYAEFVQLRAAYQSVSEQLLKQPLHKRLLEFKKMRQADPSSMALLAMAKNNQPLPAHSYHDLLAFAADDSALHSIIKNKDLIHSGRSQRNFLEPELPEINDWRYSIRPNQWLKVSLSAELNSGLHFSGADLLLIQQYITVKPEKSYLLEASIDWRISPDNRSFIELQWKDEAGKLIRKDSPIQFPCGASTGLKQLKIPFQSPEQASKVRIAIISSRQAPDDFLNIQHINFSQLRPTAR